MATVTLYEPESGELGLPDGVDLHATYAHAVMEPEPARDLMGLRAAFHADLLDAVGARSIAARFAGDTVSRTGPSKG